MLDIPPPDLASILRTVFEFEVTHLGGSGCFRVLVAERDAAVVTCDREAA